MFHLLIISALSLMHGLAVCAATPVASLKLKSRQDPPAPSPYPLGTPCPNEWMYLNFDPSDSTQMSVLSRLHEAICEDIPDMSEEALYSSMNEEQVFHRFFGQDDESHDYGSEINSVFSMIYDGSELAPLVSSFVVDNLDFDDPKNGNTCLETGGPEPGHAAYTNTDSKDQREKIHFCARAFELPDLEDVSCDDIGPAVDLKMDNFARIAIHEVFHYSSVGPPSQVDSQIIDAKNNDEIYAYFPDRSHGLVDGAQDNNPALGSINADNYAWMAVNSFFRKQCGSTNPLPNDDIYTDPPNYVPGKPIDEPL